NPTSSNASPAQAQCHLATRRKASPPRTLRQASRTPTILDRRLVRVPSNIPSLSKQTIDSEMNTLAQYLSNTVDPRRVFSVFGQEAPVQALSKYWSEYTGHSIVPEPYYEASSSYCTRNTIVSKPESLPSGHEMRLAGQSDLPAVSQLCQEFAAES
ncbi:4387_t:CDS:2, partial [Acaulospora colombiana]